MSRWSRTSWNFSRRWTAVYTAGLAEEIADRRRLEVRSDLAEHLAARRIDGHPAPRIAAELFRRTALGMHADIGWRRDMLQGARRSTAAVRGLVTTMATTSSLAIVAFHLAFAAYILGRTSLAESTYALGGMQYYGDMVGTAPGFAAILLVLAIALLAACIARPVAPLSANVTAIVVATWWIMWFWLRMWPIALVVVAASLADIFLRSPSVDSRPPT